MWNLRTLATLSKSITTKQVKVLNQLYGAVCDKQYLRTAMPANTKMHSGDDWPKINLEVEKRNRYYEAMKGHNGPNAERRNEGEVQTEKQNMDPNAWRDPLAAKIHLANPPGEGTFNISMI